MKKLVLALMLIAAGPAVAQVGKTTLLDPNIAQPAELQSVPHLTPALANAIVAKRPILSPVDLDAILTASLNEGQRKEVYGRLFLHINLNTAKPAEIKLIPNLSDRMVHEFEEYRPYRSLEQFRKEMAKYVDAKEVDRLEQYVFVPLGLNSASAKDLGTIPGMTPRMVHEFEEYRPYGSIEVYRKEIGKYVNAAEVARFERYVILDKK